VSKEILLKKKNKLYGTSSHLENKFVVEASKERLHFVKFLALASKNLDAVRTVVLSWDSPRITAKLRLFRIMA
jgi:hypothetical protein